MADTPSTPPSEASPKCAADFRRSTYDFCEKALARFAREPAQSFPKGKGLHISRAQTITGDTAERTYFFKFELKLTGCELPSE